MNNKNGMQITQEIEAQKPASAPSGVKVRRARDRQRRFPVFYIVYFTFIVLFIGAVSVGLVVLNSILAEYESVQPKYKAEEIFEEYFAKPDIAELIGMSSTKYAAFESEDKIIEYLSSQIKDKEITFSESSVKDEGGNRAYNVLCGGARFAVFSIGETEEKSAHGFTLFGLKEVKLTFSLPDNSYSFLIPEGYVLYANGVEVGEKYIAAEPVPSDAYTLTKGKLGVRFIPYTVDGFLSAPTFSVKDREGGDGALSYDEQTKIYKVEVESTTIKVPEGCVPYFGDVAIGSEFLVADGTEASVFNAFIGEGVAPLNYVTYRVNGFIEPPEVSVKDENEAECRVLFGEGSFDFESLPSYDDKLKAENAKWILEEFRELTRYIQYLPGTSKATIRSYFDTTSEAWAGINSIPPGFNYEAQSHTFEDEEVSDFIAYDEDHFSCRVQLRFIGRRGSKTYEDVTDKIVFFKKVNGKYLIYNMPITEALSGLGVDR